jgi:hemerythrin-like domain-containing protein/rubredoxin
MVEHRLIERMIVLLGREAEQIRTTGKVDTDFVLAGIQFIQLYADRSHHGKEEGILFRELKLKPLSAEHRRTLEELEAEHVQARRMTERLVATRERVLKGAAAAVKELAFALEDLVRIYPRHIRKEDEDLFLACMDYFSAEERARLLEEEQAYDRDLLNRFFQGLLDQREGRAPASPVPAGAPEGPAGAARTCMVCGYTYDPRLGDPTQGVRPGTPFEQLPEGWVCPHCHVNKAMFLSAR